MQQSSLADKLRAGIRELEGRLEEARRDLAEHLGEQEKLGCSLADVIQRQTGMGERFPTGIPTLDSRTGGGIPRGRMVVLVGKPGVGKTSLASQMAMHMIRHSRAACLALFADSGIDDASITWAQQLGIPRESAMNGEAEAVAAVTRETFGLTLQLVDPNRPYDIEDIAARFVSGLPADVAPVLLLDSAQVLRCPDAKAKTIYERVTAISNLVKTVTDRHRLITLLVSQQKRAGYANTQTAKDEDPLGSGSGSGQLEFMPDLHLALTSKDNGPMRLHCSKSRIGPHPWHVDLALDFDRHRHVEIDEASAEAEREAAETAEHEKALQGAKAKALEVARRNPEGMSSNRFEQLCGGRATLHREARRVLWEEGLLISEERPGRGGGAIWKPAMMAA